MKQKPRGDSGGTPSSDNSNNGEFISSSDREKNGFSTGGNNGPGSGSESKRKFKIEEIPTKSNSEKNPGEGEEIKKRFNEIIKKDEAFYTRLYTLIEKIISNNKKEPIKIRARKRKVNTSSTIIQLINSEIDIYAYWDENNDKVCILATLPQKMYSSAGKLKGNDENSVLGSGTYGKVKVGVELNKVDRKLKFGNLVAVKISKFVKNLDSNKKEIIAHLQREYNNAALLPEVNKKEKSLAGAEELKGKRPIIYKGKKGEHKFVQIMPFYGKYNLKRIYTSLNLIERIKVVKETTNILIKLHKLGRLHLDLKPGNIVLETVKPEKKFKYFPWFEHLNVKNVGVIDIGGATVNDNHIPPTTFRYRDISVKTTLNQEKKLVLDDKHKDHNKKVLLSIEQDKYSLGCILFEMFNIRNFREIIKNNREKTKNKVDLDLSAKERIREIIICFLVDIPEFIKEFDEFLFSIQVSEIFTKNKKNLDDAKEDINHLSEKVFTLALDLTKAETRIDLREALKRIKELESNLVKLKGTFDVDYSIKNENPKNKPQPKTDEKDIDRKSKSEPEPEPEPESESEPERDKSEIQKIKKIDEGILTSTKDENTVMSIFIGVLSNFSETTEEGDKKTKQKNKNSNEIDYGKFLENIHDLSKTALEELLALNSGGKDDSEIKDRFCKNKKLFISGIKEFLETEINKFNDFINKSSLEKKENLFYNAGEFKREAFKELDNYLNSPNLHKKQKWVEPVVTAIINVGVILNSTRKYLSIATPNDKEKKSFSEKINSFKNSQKEIKKIKKPLVKNNSKNGIKSESTSEEVGFEYRYKKLDNIFNKLIYHILSNFGFKEKAEKFKYQNPFGLFYHRMKENISEIDKHELKNDCSPKK